jgi:choline dehydrogenase-like flavoprotein
VCLEQGDWVDSNSYPSTKKNWETKKQHEYNVSPNVRNLASDYPINDTDSPIAIANYNAVGGGTIIYSAHFPRFHPSDFKVKSLDGVADDWPLSYEKLNPYFTENDRMMGVSGLAGDPAYPDREPPPGGYPVSIGPMGETMARGYNKLGWHWWPSYSAIITRSYMGREQCKNLGPCNTGCPQGAKSSADNTYWSEAVRNGVELRTRARVSKITVDNSGKATGAIYFDDSGTEIWQKSHIVILACNGVGTPRLLLNSCSKNYPNGLANRSGLVGKNLMLHPLGYVEGRFRDDIKSHLGPQGSCILSQEFYETNTERNFVRGYTMQILRSPGPIETALTGVKFRDIPWGVKHHEAFINRFGKTIGMGIIVEDLPEPHNSVTLDNKLCDSHGIPAPKITYKLSENSKKMLAHGLTKGKEVMSAAGSIYNIAFAPVRNSGWHLMGTARMGTDSCNSVVNEWGQSHDVKNLFIVDSSVFVTSGAVNPVSTMQAIALYISDMIIKNKYKIFY